MNYDSPQDLKDGLDKLVVGQEDAKWALSNAMFMHTMKVRKLITGEAESQSMHVLLVGESGSGKTFLVQSLAKSLECPMITVNCSSLTVPGFVGTDINDLVVARASKIGSNPMCIVLLDELDKLTLPCTTQGGGDHNQAIQDSLLPLLDGLPIQAERRGVTLGTNKLFIVGAGVFSNITRNSDYLTDIRAALIRSGLKPELANRFIDIQGLLPLTDEEMWDIVMAHTSSPLKFYSEVFQNCDAPFQLTDIERMIIKKEMKHNLKGIPTILFKLFSTRLKELRPGVKLFLEDLNNDLRHDHD